MATQAAFISLMRKAAHDDTLDFQFERGSVIVAILATPAALVSYFDTDKKAMEEISPSASSSQGLAIGAAGAVAAWACKSFLGGKKEPGMTEEEKKREEKKDTGAGVLAAGSIGAGLGGSIACVAGFASGPIGWAALASGSLFAGIYAAWQEEAKGK